MHALLAAAVAAASWTVDATSLWANRGAWPVTQHGRDLCPPDAPDRALAVAAVAYAKKGGVSSWGHASMRVLACVDGSLADFEYEAYKMGPDDRLRLAETLGPRPFLDDRTYLRAQRGKLLSYRNDGAVDRGFFGDALRHNREIYEVWLPLTAAARDTVWHGLERGWQDQLRRLEDRAPLPDVPYRWWSTNCTQVLQSSFPLTGLPEGPALGERRYPFAILRALEEVPDIVRVVHPSPDLLARLSRRAGSADGLADALLAGPVYVERGRRPWRAGRPAARAVVERLGDRLADLEPAAVRVARETSAKREDDDAAAGFR